jgi:hypothetical protein
MVPVSNDIEKIMYAIAHIDIRNTPIIVKCLGPWCPLAAICMTGTLSLGICLCLDYDTAGQNALYICAEHLAQQFTGYKGDITSSIE